MSEKAHLIFDEIKREAHSLSKNVLNEKKHETFFVLKQIDAGIIVQPVACFFSKVLRVKKDVTMK